MTRSLFSCGATVSGVLAVLLLTPTAAFSQNVGTAAAVRPASTGTPPGSATRTLSAGTKIVSNERIRTSQSGSLQVMFNDKSTLTVGPNSDMVVDNFVYNPNAGTGQFGINLARGTLRFVGGQISHTRGATITTPAATLGVRGGIALARHGAAECEESIRDARGRPVECTKFVCMSGKCTATSSVDNSRIQLRLNEALVIATIGATQQFGVGSVRLNEVVKGGDGISTTTLTKQNVETFDTNAIEQAIQNQTPAPPAPSPGGGGPGSPGLQ